MSVSDILSGIGSGLAKAGAVASPILERTAQVESGEAPQIDAEQRQRQTALEDAAIETKAKALEDQLQMGQKYGTLTPDQQQQYVDQITGLYSHPRHAGTLMEKLRKAIHPNGAFAQGPEAPLPNATPLGGTAAADTRAALDRRQAKPLTGVKPFKGSDGKYYQPVETGFGTIENVEVPDYTPPPVKPAGGKSPPVTGDRLPSDAAGPDGKPIPDAERTAGKSYVEFHGAFYPVAPPKPQIRQVGGDLLLIDPQNGSVMRKIAAANAKVTTRQTLQPGDDGQMHLVNLTSVTTPEGATIDVEPQQEGGITESQSGTGGKQPTPKTGAKSVSPGSILPKTGAKPTSQSSGKVVPGLSTLARSKNPTIKAEMTEAGKQLPALDAAEGSINDYINNGVFDGAGDLALQHAFFTATQPSTGFRMTKVQQDILQNSQSWANSWEAKLRHATTGTWYSDEQRKQIAKAALDAIAEKRKALNNALGQGGQDPAGGSDIDDIVKALNKGKK